MSLTTLLSDAGSKKLPSTNWRGKRAIWSLIATFLLISIAQPTAQGLDFPTTTRLNLPEGPTQSLTISKDVDLAQAVVAPISEMAQVAAMARQVELARKATGAKYVARTIMLAEYSWGDDQYGCLNRLWTKESHWNYKAHNYRSGAHGIAQALPASKMDVVGTDWRTNPVTQIRWGLRYIDSRYGTPCKAWAKFKRSKYY
jgi:hypothetical protein